MATTPLYGTTGAITTSGFGCHFNGFTFDLAQGVTGYYGYGDTWMLNNGTISSWSGSLGGFTTFGSSTDTPVAASGLAPITTRVGVSITMTWNTGEYVSGTAVITANHNANNFLGTPTTGYSYVGSGAPALTWATS